MSKDRRLRRFRNKTFKSTIPELRLLILKLNIQYYQGLQFFLNPNPPHPDQDLEYITSIDKKIEVANNTIHIKLAEEEERRIQQVRRVAEWRL